MNHPSGIRLESFACGEPNTDVETHLAECSDCRSFVDGVRSALGAGPSRAEAAERVARIAESAPRPVRSPWPLRAASVAVPLAAAAALLFLLRTPGRPEPKAEAPAPASESLALATTAEPTITFKGGVQVAVIRERSGSQARFADRVTVKPGDRLRVEVALDRDQDILAAVMGEDGSWLELMPEGIRRPGTHFSDRSARVDASPLRGIVLVGPPAAMKRAKESKDPSGLAAIRIDWEKP